MNYDGVVNVRKIFYLANSLCWTFDTERIRDDNRSRSVVKVNNRGPTIP
jgi:hypothetical protein